MKNAFQSTPARPNNPQAKVKTETLPEIIEESRYDDFLSQGSREIPSFDSKITVQGLYLC